MGKAADVWQQLTGLLESGDVTELVDLYGIDAEYLEPYNAPHHGNLLIQAYLKDYLGGKEDVDIEERRVIESPDERSVAVEWAISYTAGGRRWNHLPRASFLTLDDEGLINYQRDYA